MKNKKTGITALILVVSACALVSIALVIGAYYLLKAQKNYTSPTQVVTPTEIATASPETGTMPPEIASQMDEIQKQVISIRGMELKNELQRDLMTPEDLKEKVINDFFKDYTAEDETNDTKILSTLGLIDSNFDLRQFYLDLYSEQIAGYYDSETKEMYVISGETFGGTERMTYAHEFNHALQDQNYDLENGLKLNDDYCETDTEYCAAVTALIEGDSSLTEQYWFMQYATRQDQKDVLKFQDSYTSPVYDSAPEYMKEDFLFPYLQGMDFVTSLHDSGGWQAVDKAFVHPPVSTEQILHPEKYPSDTPVVVEMPDFSGALGSDWKELDRNVMGEWYTYLVLAKGRSADFRMDEATAKQAAAGWGGDTYVFYSEQGTGDTLFSWRSRWETAEDMDEFFNLSEDYGVARWGEPANRSSTEVRWNSATDGQIIMRRKGTDVLWLMGSSENTIEEALTLLQDSGI